jgi:hypothetical protein
MDLYSNVRVVNNGLFKESRFFFDEFDVNNDINPSTNKAGIRCHHVICALILKIFGKIEEIKTSEGKIFYVNKGSLDNWKNRHWANLPQEMKSQNLPSAADIIKYYKDLKKQPVITNLPEETDSTTSINEEENQDEIIEINPIIKTDQVISYSPKVTPLQLKGLLLLYGGRSVVPPHLFTAYNARQWNNFQLVRIPQNLPPITSMDDEKIEDNTKNVDRELNLVKRWGMKVIPEIFPEIKAPLAILKTGQVLSDAADKYQEGDTLGAIQKVAPMAVGGALL